MYHPLTWLGALVPAVLLACAPRGQTTAIEQNRALVQQFYQEFDAAPSLEVVDRWLTSDYKNHMAGAPEPLDIATYRELLTQFFTGFSEMNHAIREMVAEEDRVALFVDISMKHTGQFEGIAPTGRTISVSEMLILRINDGKIAEEWIVFDNASLMQQLQAAETEQ